MVIFWSFCNESVLELTELLHVSPPPSGCWTHLGDNQSCREDRCVVTNLPPQMQNGTYLFCCCGSDMCNVNFTEDFSTPRPTTAQPICEHTHSCPDTICMISVCFG